MLLEESYLTEKNKPRVIWSMLYEPYQLPMAAIRCGTNMEIG